MTFIQFTQTRTIEWDSGQKCLVDCPPVQEDCLGSDGVFILDGRNKLGTMVSDAYDRIEKLRPLKKGITGFQIRKGSIRESRQIYEASSL